MAKFRPRPSTGKVCYCPMCHQFGRPAPGVAVEGKARNGDPIMLCTSCGAVPAKRTHKDLPGQKLLDFGDLDGKMP
jgi:hypothetical protein